MIAAYRRTHSPSQVVWYEGQRPHGDVLHLLHERPLWAPGVVRIDPLRFLAGCRKRRQNQALSVLSLSLGFF